MIVIWGLEMEGKGGRLMERIMGVQAGSCHGCGEKLANAGTALIIVTTVITAIIGPFRRAARREGGKW
jgi:hypothetical protein